MLISIRKYEKVKKKKKKKVHKKKSALLCFVLVLGKQGQSPRQFLWHLPPTKKIVNPNFDIVQ